MENKKRGQRTYSHQTNEGQNAPYSTGNRPVHTGRPDGERRSRPDKPYGEKKTYGQNSGYGERKSHAAKPYADRSTGNGKPYRSFDKSAGRNRFPDKPEDEPRPETAVDTGERESAGISDVPDTGIHGDYENGAVIGRNAVRELLRSGRSVDKILVQRGERTGSITVLVAEAISRGIPVIEVERAKLDTLAGFAPHQGIVAMAAEKEYCEVDDILKIAADRGEAPLIVIADGITDPYNLGALIRCAEGVGAHGLIIPKRHASGLTPLVTKASAGAIEHLAIAKVSNLTNTVKKLQAEGVWVYAAEAGGQDYYDCNFSGPCALVFGSEGDGVSRLVKETCDAIVSIPMYGQVNSFNVSTAGAVILAEASRQHHRN